MRSQPASARRRWVLRGVAILGALVLLAGIGWGAALVWRATVAPAVAGAAAAATPGSYDFAPPGLVSRYAPQGPRSR